jgi:hypothetical protein
MAAMAVVHEEMHQGTRQQQQERQHTEDMRLMFGEQVEPADDQECDKPNVPSRGEEATALLM